MSNRAPGKPNPLPTESTWLRARPLAGRETSELGPLLPDLSKVNVLPVLGLLQDGLSPVPRRQEPGFTPPAPPVSSTGSGTQEAVNRHMLHRPKGHLFLKENYCCTVIASHFRELRGISPEYGEAVTHPGKWQPQPLQPRWPPLIAGLGTPRLHSQSVLGQLQTPDGQIALHHMGTPCIKVSASLRWQMTHTHASRCRRPAPQGFVGGGSSLTPSKICFSY